MHDLFAVLVVIVALYLVFLYGKTRHGGKSREDEIHFIRAADGWRLALHHYLPRGDRPHGEPVFLHHGLASNHLTFDLGVGAPASPTPSLAIWLAEHGYDVWAADVRGAGDSDRPGLFGRRWNWSLDDYLLQDDPAFIDAILAKTGYRNLHWIGHSMGGILLFSFCALDGSPKLACGVAVGSGLAYAGTGSHFEPLAKYRKYVRRLGRAPLGTLGKIYAPLCGRWSLPFEAFNYHPGNMAPAAARAIWGGVLSNTSSRVLHQLASMFEPGGLRSADGQTIYSEKVGAVTTPLLLIAGDYDRQSSKLLSTQTHALFPGDQHQTAFFGPEFGHATHYGHFDLLLGRHAEEEVYPRILAWLGDHPAQKLA